MHSESTKGKKKKGVKHNVISQNEIKKKKKKKQIRMGKKKESNSKSMDQQTMSGKATRFI